MINGFKFYKPCKLLQDYVRYYWTFESDKMIETYTFPIGCPQIIFHKKSTLYIPELDKRQDTLTISGQVNFSSHISADDSIEMIVAVLHPYAMNIFLDIPTLHFYNKETSGYEIGNLQLNCLASKIFDSKNINICISYIEQWLISQLQSNYTPKHKTDINRIRAAVHQLYLAPNTQISKLASISCLGKKQFERIFLTTVGMNPKEYARIVRFQKALKFIQEQGKNISQAQIAYQSGFSDQSHFIREFKEFSGYTPLSLMEICKPYSDLFTVPV
jgi:AraC-like DNA-binding protein